MATMPRMSTNEAPAPPVETLTESEIHALATGAAWYAKYHQNDVPSSETDRSAAATVRREHFEALYSGLEKLGVRIRRPDAIRTAADSAA